MKNRVPGLISVLEQFVGKGAEKFMEGVSGIFYRNELIAASRTVSHMSNISATPAAIKEL